jgi:hypothetical protein
MLIRELSHKVFDVIERHLNRLFVARFTLRITSNNAPDRRHRRLIAIVD